MQEFTKKSKHGSRMLCFSGVDGSARGFLISRLAKCGKISVGETVVSTVEPPAVVVAVVANASEGEKLVADLEFFLSDNVTDSEQSSWIRPEICRFFPWEVLPFEALSPAQEISAERLYSLSRIVRGFSTVVVCPASALMQRLVSPKCLLGSLFTIHRGTSLDRDRLIEHLDEVGYLRTSLVEECGQLAVRGGVVDFFPGGSEYPLRLELFGNVVESIRTFNPENQRSIEFLETAEIIPVRELFVEEAEKGRGNSSEGRPGASTERSWAEINLRARALELELPERQVLPMIDALKHGANYPGLEQLQALFCVEQARSFWDYLPKDAAVVLCDELAVERSAHEFEELVEERAAVAKDDGYLYVEPQTAYYSAAQFNQSMLAQTSHVLNSLGFLSTPRASSTERSFDEKEGTVELKLYSNSELSQAIQLGRSKEFPFKPLADEIKKLHSEGIRIAVVVSRMSRARRIEQLLSGYEIDVRIFPGSFSAFLSGKAGCVEVVGKTPEVTVLEGSLTSGLRVPEENFVLILETEIFHEISPRRKVRSLGNIRRFLGNASQLQEDDYVVHVEHGVGIYRGLKQIAVEGKIGDFLSLEYANQARLFIPVENIGKVQKYIGGEGQQRPLNKLGGKSWERSKAKVRRSVAELAGQLIQIYAQRSVLPGFSFGEIDTDDLQFADEFSFNETPDQQQAIDEVLADMARQQPMDRLVCGDVGYGKTEVAIRAAFKVVNAGKQVAVLVPTTVLAAQHLATFKERFANYPMEIRTVSRFFTSAQNKETLALLAQGKVDIIIGTHRLIQRDVFFHNLGMVIIDEEHRFGVAAKEKLKRFRREVDVLTLTATPIPRTLHMSMLGIRDLSVIETPPNDRHAIRSYIAPYNDAIVREAILREIGRNGQVFYVHNRVATIGAVFDELTVLVPEARIEVAHGQMKKKGLENVMCRFLAGDIDVLLCTTIVESGLDIPNANTIIFRRADSFGLAELYQLRGRVGRSSKRAYAYLLISDPKTLGVEAKKRLKVLQSLDDLGMGFRLALQDMEIRGAGNLLGRDQSGHVQEVGFDLYSRILKQAVEEIRQSERFGESHGGVSPGAGVPDVDPELNIGFPAHIPLDYIPDVAERLVLYQRLVELRDEAHGFELAEEIEDRFGRMPEEVSILVELMIFRSLLRSTGVVSAKYRGNQLTLAFHPEAPLNPEKIISLVAGSKGKMKFSPDLVLKVNLEGRAVESPKNLYRVTENIIFGIGA